MFPLVTEKGFSWPKVVRRLEGKGQLGSSSELVLQLELVGPAI